MPELTTNVFYYCDNLDILRRYIPFAQPARCRIRKPRARITRATSAA